MSWIAIRDLQHLPKADRAVGTTTDSASAELLSQGTILFETRGWERAGQSIQLLRFKVGDGDAAFTISFGLTKGGDVVLGLEQGEHRQACFIEAEAGFHNEPLLCCFSWDAASMCGELFVQNLHNGESSSAQVEVSSPLPGAILLDWMQADSTLSYVALADHEDTPAIRPTLTTDCPVLTPEGLVPVSTLRPGSIVETLDYGPQVVRAVQQREVPALGHFQPVRLRAPYFDLSQDILVAAGQQMLINDDIVEYLFGEEEVLVEVGQITDGKSALAETRLETVCYQQLILDRHEILDVAGARLCSQVPPDSATGAQQHLARPALRPYEAVTLRSVRNR